MPWAQAVGSRDVFVGRGKSSPKIENLFIPLDAILGDGDRRPLTLSILTDSVYQLPP